MYLVNILRQGGLSTFEEKLSLALNLGRLAPNRYYHVYNAMLGRLGLDDASMTDRVPKFKDDRDLQLAALEALYHLRSREARRILYHAAHEGRGGVTKQAKQLWQVVKSSGYTDPTLPRSPHDPEWTEDDLFNFQVVLDEGATLLQKVDDGAEQEGLVSLIKGLFQRKKKASSPPDLGAEGNDKFTDGDLPPIMPLDSDKTADQGSNDSTPEPIDLVAETPPSPPPPRTPEVGLHLEAMIQRDTRAWSGRVPMTFTIHASADDDNPLFTDTQSEVLVTAGRFEVTVGSDVALPLLPKKIWMQIEVDGEPLEPRMEVSNYRSVVQG